MAEGSGGQRYCRNCGAELRPGLSFCTSCGTPVSPVAGGPGPSSSGPDGPGRLGSFVGDLRRSFRQSADGLRGTFSGSANGLRGTFSGVGTDGIRRIPGRISGWFKDLPGAPKLVIVGVVALILLVLLSPVAMVLAGGLLVLSIVALAIRIRQKGPIRNWGMVAVASVVLMFTFGGISGALYGDGGETSSRQTGGGDAGAPEVTQIAADDPGSAPASPPSSPPPSSPPPSSAPSDGTCATGDYTIVDTEEAYFNGANVAYVAVSGCASAMNMELAKTEVQTQTMMSDLVHLYYFDDDYPNPTVAEGRLGNYFYMFRWVNGYGAY